MCKVSTQPPAGRRRADPEGNSGRAQCTEHGAGAPPTRESGNAITMLVCKGKNYAVSSPALKPTRPPPFEANRSPHSQHVKGDARPPSLLSARSSLLGGGCLLGRLVPERGGGRQAVERTGQPRKSTNGRNVSSSSSSSPALCRQARLPPPRALVALPNGPRGPLRWQQRF